MDAEMEDTKDAINVMRDNSFAVDSRSNESGDDRRTSLDEATAIHQVTIGGTQRPSSSKYLLSSS